LRALTVALAVATLGAALGGVAATPARASDNQPDVVGGSDAAQGEFPWMVRLSMGCGGALFTPTLVLTAAHCFHQSTGATTVTVTQGAVDLQDPNRTIRTASFVKIPQGFVDPVKGNDWALLQLDSPIFGVPLLKIASDDSFLNGTFTVMGWGATSNGGDQQRKLKKADVDFISNSVCKRSGGAYADMNASQEICAGNYDHGGVDTCQGDSGGPMVKRNAAGEWVQVGITSWGVRCGEAQLPGVYSRVSAFASDICAAAGALGGCPTVAVDVLPNFTCPLGSGFFIRLSATGGAQPYTWSISGLPGGLSFDTSTGQIAGFLTQPGNFFVTYTVSDGMNAPVTNAFSLIVTLPVPDVGGTRQSAATNTIEAAGLAVGSVATVTVFDSSDGGRVMSQSPAAGTQVQLGSRVNLTIGQWSGVNR
jgi:hypothetical protein